MAVKTPKISKTRDFDHKAPYSELNVNTFNQQIQDHGVRVKVYKTMLCPNIKRLGGHHEVDCKICDNGFIDLDPIDSWASFYNATSKKTLDKEGTWDDQMVDATLISGVELNYFAKVELTDFTSTFQETIIRGKGEVDILKYPATSVNVMLDADGKRYYEGTDFKMSPTGDIQWDLKNAPSENVIYSIHYNYPITFRAITAKNINRFTSISLKLNHKKPIEFPSRWQLKRDFLIDRVDIDNNPVHTGRKFSYKDEGEE